MSASPILLLTLHTEEQVILANQLMRLDNTANVWHLDATGSVIRWEKDSPPVYYYALVQAMNQKGMPALPLLEFLSNRHSIAQLETAFNFWWSPIKKFCLKPHFIVVDFSWALIHSALAIFANETIDSHLKRLWLRFFPGESDDNFSIRICASHFIKSVQRRISRQNVPSQVS